jgi:hypothetical protein
MEGCQDIIKLHSGKRCHILNNLICGIQVRFHLYEGPPSFRLLQDNLLIDQTFEPDPEIKTA